MRTRNNTKFRVICITLAAISFIFAGTYLMKGKVSNAADTVHVAIEEGVILSKYDVDGDGKPDKVKYTVVDNKDDNSSATMRVSINDKIAFEQKRDFNPGWYLSLIKLENGKAFFDISSKIGSDDDCIHQLYLCKDNKLKSVYNFQKYFENYADYYFADVVKVSGNTLKLSVYDSVKFCSGF